MSDELNVWREASDAASENAVKWKPAAETRAAAVIRSYGDQRYQAAIDDVVKWLNAKQEGRTSDNYPAFYANEITRLTSQLRAAEEREKGLREALGATESAIAEYYRYWTGGETRGSYDGKPERAGLWKSQQTARAALKGPSHDA